MVLKKRCQWIINSRYNVIINMVFRVTVKDKAKTIEDLHRRFGGVIFDHCLRILGTRADAEDAVQETFVNAYRALSSFHYGDSHLPWLYRIATNTSLKVIRSRKRYASRDQTEPIAQMPDNNSSDVADNLHARRALESLTDELDLRSMEILEAHCVSRMNQSEIADFLGISRRAVVKRLTAIRSRATELFGEGV